MTDKSYDNLHDKMSILYIWIIHIIKIAESRVQSMWDRT